MMLNTNYYVENKCIITIKILENIKSFKIYIIYHASNILYVYETNINHYLHKNSLIV